MRDALHYLEHLTHIELPKVRKCHTANNTLFYAFCIGLFVYIITLKCFDDLVQTGDK